MFEASPLTPTELNKYCIEFKGSYRYHTGTLGFAACQTRVDIKFAVQRIDEFNNDPIAPEFHAIARIYRYLSRDPL